MQDCLGGNSITSFIATISPDHNSLGETLSTLKFAARASNVKTEVSINKMETDNSHLKILERYNKDFRRKMRSSLAMKYGDIDGLDINM